MNNNQTAENNSQISKDNNKILRSNDQTGKHRFDLEHRTTEFAKKAIRLCKRLSRNSINDRLTGQVVGAAGSMGANYREANDALGKKDFLNRMRIARKETKEAIHWLELIETANSGFESEIQRLIAEATEYRNIFSSIINKSQ